MGVAGRPRGFVKIRYYGFLANRRRSAEPARCRELLQVSAVSDDAATILTGEQRQAVERPCPLCRQGMERSRCCEDPKLNEGLSVLFAPRLGVIAD